MANGLGRMMSSGDDGRLGWFRLIQRAFAQLTIVDTIMMNCFGTLILGSMYVERVSGNNQTSHLSARASERLKDQFMSKFYIWICEGNFIDSGWEPWIAVGVRETRRGIKRCAVEYFTKHWVGWVWINEDPSTNRLSPRRVRFRKYSIRSVKK